MDKVPGLLKAFVVGSGVLVLGGTVLLVVLLISRAADRGEDAAPPGRPAELVLPPGSTIEQLVPDGRDRVLLLGTDAEGRQFIAVIDPATGERLSLVHIVPESP